MQRRYIRRVPITPVKRFPVNHQIRVPEVMVIDEAGTSLGVMQTADALRLAQEQEHDLIEVSPLANPPVCRIMNLGKWQYQQSQKQRKQKTLDTKVIRLTFKIGEHDRQVRLSQTRKFLDKGHRVKLEMRLKGRERAFAEKAKEMIRTYIRDIGPDAIEDQPLTFQGMAINVLISKKSRS